MKNAQQQTHHHVTTDTKRILRKLTMAGQEITIFTDSDNRISAEITDTASIVERTIHLDSGQRIIVSLDVETMDVRAEVWTPPIYQKWIKGVKAAREIAALHFKHLTSRDFFGGYEKAKKAGASAEILELLEAQASKLETADLRGLSEYYRDFLLDHVSMDDFQAFFLEAGNALDFVESVMYS